MSLIQARQVFQRSFDTRRPNAMESLLHTLSIRFDFCVPSQAVDAFSELPAEGRFLDGHESRLAECRAPK